MNKSDIEWVDPPKVVAPEDHLAGIVGELKENPGRWACILRRGSTASTWWRPLQGDSNIEVKKVNMDVLGFVYDIYARYIAEDQECSK